MNKEIMSLLSICKKAGFVKSGDFQAGNCLTSGSAKLIIMAKNAEIGTKQKFYNKAFYYEIPYIVYGTKEQISWTIGKNDCAVVAIIDQGMADNLIELLTKAVEEDDEDAE